MKFSPMPGDDLLFSCLNLPELPAIDAFFFTDSEVEILEKDDTPLNLMDSDIKSVQHDDFDDDQSQIG